MLLLMTNGGQLIRSYCKPTNKWYHQSLISVLTIAWEMSHISYCPVLAVTDTWWLSSNRMSTVPITITAPQYQSAHNHSCHCYHTCSLYSVWLTPTFTASYIHSTYTGANWFCMLAPTIKLRNPWGNVVQYICTQSPVLWFWCQIGKPMENTGCQSEPWKREKWCNVG